MTAAAPDTFPKSALIATGALLLAAVGGTAAVRIARIVSPPAPVAAPVAASAVDLRFGDRADGAVTVSRADGAPVAVLAPDTNGFVRGVMRGLARERLSRHLGAAAPFRLSRDTAGRLWLQDLATRRLVDLEAFGGDNRAAFAAFLPRAQGSARA
jgi:putative photosynthetic complex assembly protein